MSKRLMKYCVLSVVCSLWSVVYSYAEPIPSTALIEDSKKHDGEFVEYQGEVVGDVMLRGGHAWVSVNDGKYAIGVWCSKDSAGKISHAGEYKYRGDVISVQGAFHRACREHGGDLDIHARNISIIRKGRPIQRPVKGDKIIHSIVFSIVASGFALLSLIRSRRKEKT